MSAEATILLVGALAAVACALPGCFLVLRGMSLLGDAISHAVLPGIVVAFLVTGSITSVPVLLGASVFGLLTVLLIEIVHRTRRVKEDASIAVVFPALFALGVLLVSRFAEQRDLDQDCVLYGEIAFAPENTMALLGGEVPKAVLVLAIAALISLLFVTVFYKELKVTTFDPALAAALGVSPVLLHYLLMAVVSLTTVASFESIGAILVVAFLVVPAAAANLLTDKLPGMLIRAAVLGAGASAAGYYGARAWNASIAGCMAGAMGAMFVAVWVLAPREGLIGRLLRLRRTRRRIALALLLERLERQPAGAEALPGQLAWKASRVEAALRDLAGRGCVEEHAGLLHPTDEGRRLLRKVVE